MVHAVLLAGGRGERFWPLSRSGRAKQFLAIAGDRTLLADTRRRLGPLVPDSRLIVVTGRDQTELVKESLPSLPDSGLLAEPFGRNTAPAVALAAAHALATDPDAVLLVLPSDAWIGDEDLYRETLKKALDAAERETVLVTIGITPNRPETGYGYVEVGRPIEGLSDVFRVERFVEKPDATQALRYLEEGRHLWNAGIFVMRAGVFLEAVRRHLPELDAALETLKNAGGPGRPEAIDAFYAAAPSISIDYGVMEKADNVLTVRAAFPWDDLGSWAALDRVLPRDGDHLSYGDAIVVDSPDSIVYSDEGFVAVLGVPGIIVVRTGDATLVLPRERAQEVRRIVQMLVRRDDLDRYR